MAGIAHADVPADVAPLAPVAAGATTIPDHYIVQVRDDADAASAASAATQSGAVVKRVFTTAVDGFAAQLSPKALATVRADPRVTSVERDQVVTATADQPGATWGLDRIDQRGLPLNGTYGYNFTGAGVKAYIIDTGIRLDHADFGGRAVAGVDEVHGVSPPATDCNGHGTHVSGTIGGATYGVAKAVTLIAVRVLDCNGSGTISGVIAGIDWVTANHQQGQAAVANMSLGGGASPALDNAVAASVADGVTYAVAAGNSTADACSTSPARAPSAITVGATSSNDARAYFSNYGPCVDVFAPGLNITSDWNTSRTATNTISGTSMATPHVVGIAALILAASPHLTPAQVTSALLARATVGLVGDRGAGSPNRLLYSRAGVSAATVPSAPSNVTAAAGNARATTSWVAPFNGGKAITGYTVTRYPGRVTKVVPPSVRAVAFTGLTNGAPYTFTVTATNQLGTGPASARSAAATPAPPVANDLFANATVLPTNRGTATGTTMGATKEAGEANILDFAGGHSIWYRWTAPSNGQLVVDTSGSAFDTLLGAYTGASVSSLTLSAQNDDATPGANLQSSVTFSVTAGTVYSIAVDGYAAAAGPTTLNWVFTSA
jgi:aqualysin 1